MTEDTISGEVERVVYRNEANDWSVLRLKVAGKSELQTLVGITTAQAGQHVTASGKWGRRNGEPQFEAHRITASNPTTPEGIAAYLGSGMIPGIGPKKAALMVRTFGVEVLDILDNAPERLAEIRGFGPTTCTKIAQGWQQQKSVSQIMLFLHSHNISAALCRRIYKAYGDEAISTIQGNPYRLCFDVRGIGFKTADAIAKSLSIPPESPQRILAGLVYLLNEAMTQGHCGMPRVELLRAAKEALCVEEAAIVPVLQADLTGAGPEKSQFVQHDEVVYLRWLAEAEERIAERLIERASIPPAWAGNHDGLIAAAEERAGMRLAGKQRAAVQMALSSRVCVITGGPGVGKTATLNVLLDVLRSMKLRIALAAPTGKAAQRASEATGMQGSTIHRLLGIRGPDSRPQGEVEADVLVIDEFSMVDVPLMRHIVRAWGRKTALIMVGDVDQLPSVGPGQVLADIIRSKAIPVTVLDEVFRQAAGSLIIQNAHAINHGRMPESGRPDDDFFVLTETNTPALRAAMSLEDDTAIPAAVAEATADIIESLVRQRLPAKYGFHPVRDIQVLCPMNKGSAGVAAMNERLQRALNPSPAAQVTRYGVRFGVGDKVIQSRNNYDLEIYNGDMGVILDIDDEEETVAVRFDGRTVAIPFDDLDDLRLAYAMTIHKSQGSQAPAVVIPVVTQHWTMLQRNLLYTGVTRARKLVVLVGQRRAIAAAVRTVSAARRVTRLRELLVSAQAQDPSCLFPDYQLHAA